VTRIALMTLGPVEPRVLRLMGETLESTFGAHILPLTALPDPAHAFDMGRAQYSSTVILRDVLGKKPPGAAKIVAITERDLFIPMLTFVFGQAQIDGAAAVVSLARLRTEYYGGEPDSALLVERALKEVVHETGHTFGLTHCHNTSCPMSLSNTVEQVDGKGKDLCVSCSLLLADRLRNPISKE
jgi:archaemetzincin